jgi:hypothetical protein
LSLRANKFGLFTKLVVLLLVLEDKEFPNAGVNADFPPKGLLSILLLVLTILLLVIPNSLILLIKLLLKPIC